MALGNKKRLANTLNTMGMAYREDGDYPKAIAYQKQSLALKQTLKDTKGMAASYNGVITSYSIHYTKLYDTLVAMR